MLNMVRATYEAFPIEVKAFLKESLITTIKNNSRSSVFRVENESQPIFLKVTPKGEMQSEAQMTDFLSTQRVCPKVLLYTADHKSDYMITSRIIGQDAADDEYLAQPEHLAEVFTRSLLTFQRLEHEGCPRTNGLSEMFERAQKNYREGKAEKSILRYLDYTSARTAYIEMTELFANVHEDMVMIHGDYCLPNLILHHFERSGYIDVGYGGLGDRHFDIFWALWSLQFNLKSDQYANTFIHNYGKNNIDKDSLRLCGLLSAFNGFRGQDYYD